MIDRRRRVLVFNHFAAPPSQAGGTRHVELFGRVENWDHLIIASDLNPQTGQRVAAEPGFQVVAVPSYSSNGVKRVLNWAAYGWRALRLGLDQGHVDVVYGSSPHLLAPLAAWLVAKRNRAPFVMEVRDLWPRVLLDMGQLRERSWIYRILTYLERFLYSRAERIVVMALGSRQHLLTLGVSESKIVYIPNGSDPEQFVPSASRHVLRQRYAFTRFTAVYTGAHGPANGLNLLLDAATRLQNEPIDIVLIGGGVAKQDLVGLAEKMRLTNVRFLEPIPKSDIPDVLRAADLGLHVLADVAVFQDSVSPNKLFDYMAAGLPVLTNCPGNVSELVESIECGYACEPRDMAQALRRALREKNNSDEKGQAGKAWLGAHQSRRAMAARLEAVLNEAAVQG